MSYYQNVVVETYHGRYTAETGGIHYRPLPGQGLATDMNVEWSRSVRKKYPVGTRFLICAKVTNKENGNDFLYCHYNAKYEVIRDEDLGMYIKNV